MLLLKLLMGDYIYKKDLLDSGAEFFRLLVYIISKLILYEKNRDLDSYLDLCFM